MMLRDLRFPLLALTLALLLSGCAPPKRPRVLWPVSPDTPRIEWLGTYASQDEFPKTGLQSFFEGLLGKPELAVFQSPFGIVSDGQGIVYVADNIDHNLRVYDLNNHTVNYFSKDPLFDRPAGLALDAAGNLYVVDIGRRSVTVFDRERRPLRTIGSPEELQTPAYIEIDEARDRIYVSDPRANRIVVYNLAGVKQREIGPELVKDATYLFNPQGMAIDKEGNLFIAEVLASRISVVAPDGTFLRSFGERGDAFYQFEAPKDLAFDSDGNLWVVDNRRTQIYTYAPDGTVLLTTGSATRSANALDFAAPTAIHIAPDDSIYVSDRMNRRFSVWRYLSERYLAEHPFTPAEQAYLDELGQRARQLREEAEKKPETPAAPAGGK